MNKINYYWRLVATAISFLCFGLGGLLMPFIVAPIKLLTHDENQLEKRIKWVIHRSFYLFMRLMRSLGVCTFEVNGIEKLERQGLLILGNHPTLIDVVFLISLLPRADCVVKSGLLKNPFTRGPISAGRYIANDNAEDTIQSAKASLSRGNNLVVFPEGTRTQPGKPLKLQRGAANIAIRTANNITPVVIKCTPSTLTKQENWYNIPSRRFHISISVREDIDIAPYLQKVPSVAARELSKNLTDYFEKEINRDE